jgi:hypothetical protein
MEGSGRDLIFGTIRHFTGGIEKSTKNLTRDSRYPGPTEYEGVLTTRPLR